MCKLSLIIPNTDNYLNCLQSVLSQTFGDIEIFCIYDSQNYIVLRQYSKDKRIKLVHENSQISEVNGEYVLFVEDVITNDVCELLYNYAKSNNLDCLYIPKYDFSAKVKLKEVDFKVFSFFYASLYKKSFFNFAGEHVEFKNTDFYMDKLYCEMNFDESIYVNTLKKLFAAPNKSEINLSFLIFMEYLNNFPLPQRQKIYFFIKNNFKPDYLNENNQLTFRMILENDYYLDFSSNYLLECVDYDIYCKEMFEGNNYKITVVIPIYNYGTLIHRTLMSIENQSFNFADIEVLMINDASDGNTVDIINQYVDKYSNFKAIHIKEGTGSPGTPRNIGLKLSSADYLLFLDHDDFLDIHALEKLYEKITEFDCDVVYGTYALIDGDKPIKFTYPNEKHGFFKSLKDNPRSISTPPSIWTKLFKKEFLLKNNILFPMILGEDAVFMAKVLKNACGVYYMGEDVICYYNLNDKSYTTNLSYNYFVEGFVSENYLFGLFTDWNHVEYYALREGVLEYYINRYMLSNLTDDEIRDLFPLFHEFCKKFYQLGIKPKSERNLHVFKYVLEEDVEDLIKFKNRKPNKIRELLNKINKHGFW